MNQLTKSKALDELHGDEVRTIALGNLIDMRDVRMIQGCGSFGLANESLHATAIRSDLGGKNLQCDFAIERCIVRQIHLAHPTSADFRADFVATEICACGKRHFFTSAVKLIPTVYGKLDV